MTAKGGWWTGVCYTVYTFFCMFEMLHNNKKRHKTNARNFVNVCL